jgi:hypothetical protein
MRPYKSKDSNTGVSFYEPGKDHIIIRFRIGGTYLYDHKKPGRKAVEKMKLLAEKGKGLSTYINKYVRENYAARIE